MMQAGRGEIGVVTLKYEGSVRDNSCRMNHLLIHTFPGKEKYATVMEISHFTNRWMIVLVIVVVLQENVIFFIMSSFR